MEIKHILILLNNKCGAILAQNEHYDEAINYYNELKKIITKEENEWLATLKHNSAIIYSRHKKNHKEAIELSKNAIELTKDSVSVDRFTVRLGANYRRAGLYDKSISVMKSMIEDSVIEIQETNLRAHYQLAKSYFEVGYFDSSEYYLKKSLVIDPSHSHYAYFWNLFELGKALVAQNRHKEAIEYFEQAINYTAANDQNEPEFFEVYQFLSEAYLSVGNVAKYQFHQKRYSEGLATYTLNKQKHDLAQLTEDYYANIEQEAREASVRTYSIVISGSLLVLLGLTFSVSRYQRHRTKKKLEKESIDKRMAELKALKAQINPHFLFNALNSIQSYILSDEKNVAEGYLVKYGKLMRKILDHSNELTVPLQEELEALHLYVELEQLRVKQGFEYEVKLSDDLDPYLVQVPSMVIQPFIENAIWHGVSPLDHPGKITLSFEEEGDFIVVRVQDNGVGFDSGGENTNHTSKGVGLVRERLELLKASAGEESVLSIHSEPGKGTEVVLRF
ncbi:MAG: histidine kinase, partial [Bacteroidota bacterium]